MPQSPFRKTLYPPIQDLDEFKTDLSKHRWELCQGQDVDREELLDVGDILFEHCEFLDKKLRTKVRKKKSNPGLARASHSGLNEADKRPTFYSETRIYRAN